MRVTEPQNIVEISKFYAHIRDYWKHLSMSTDGKYSGMLNFGYWPEGCPDLFKAHQFLLEKVCSTLDQRNCVDQGLEIGCGIGGISIGMLKALPELRMTAIDISSEQLEIARANAAEVNLLSRIQFRDCDSMALSFDSGQFDFSLCIESSFHYDNKATFFAENYRILKPGGQAVLADITCEDAKQIGFRRGNYFESKQRYIELAESAGFLVESIEDIGIHVYPSLYQHILAFNKNHRKWNGKYWSIVLHNYAKLAAIGIMGYHFFRFRKPE